MASLIISCFGKELLNDDVGCWNNTVFSYFYNIFISVSVNHTVQPDGLPPRDAPYYCAEKCQFLSSPVLPDLPPRRR